MDQLQRIIRLFDLDSKAKGNLQAGNIVVSWRHPYAQAVNMASISRRVLVVGGGPAGTVTAFWLAQAGFNVTIAERSNNSSAYGQGIDITGPAVEIVRQMGLEDTIRSKSTGESGFAILDDNANDIGVFGTASTEGDSFTLTQEIEVMRGELTRILADAAKTNENITFRYGCNVTEIRQSNKHVIAVLSDTGKPEDFAIIVGADGLRSKVRKLGFDSSQTKDCYQPRDLYCAFFSIPSEPNDWPNSRFQHAPGGRSILIRPVDKTRSSCYLNCPDPKLREVAEQTSEVQKSALTEIFVDFPGLGKRAMKDMQNAENFYFLRIAQIKLKEWHNNRCVLVGDAGYAPGPITGQGTTLAILGAYVLAGEIVANPDDPIAAFGNYEKRLRDYVTKSQSIPLGGYAPNLVNPRSALGIRILRFVFWFVAWSGVWKWLDVSAKKEFPLPKYDMKIQ